MYGHRPSPFRARATFVNVNIRRPPAAAYCICIQVSRKLDVSTPPAALVDAYLSEIAKGYGVPWSPPKPGGDVNDDNTEGGVKVRLPH